MSARLLVVEDDDIQQDILKSALIQRGYDVDVAPDGLAAVRKLRAGGYDLALVDYRLPEIDGLATARLLRDLMSEADRPKLIAVTASADNLSGRSLSDNAFDAIVAKSGDLSALLGEVDRHLRGSATEQTRMAAEAHWREAGLAGAPAVATLPAPSPAQAQLLRCYFDLSGQREPEAVLLLEPEAAELAQSARATSAQFALPFIDLTGAIVGADARFTATDRATWHAVAIAVAQFAERRRSIARALLGAVSREERLLAYIFLTARTFQPEADPESRDCVRYPGLFPSTEAREAAEALATAGLLERRFFERYHLCAGCSSSRLNVREECPSCHSAQLRDMPLVHHFRCAHQAGEAEFIQGPHLVCPKCRQTLRHYGSDYDKPGTASCCGACGVTSPEPAIGFTCLDCGCRTPGEAAAKRDVFAYAITAAGVASLRRGTARLAPIDDLGSLSMSRALRLELDRPAPIVAVLDIRYAAAASIAARRGPQALAAMRRLFMENLVNALQAECAVVSEPEADYVVVRAIDPAILRDLGPAMLESCQEVLAEGLEPEVGRLDLLAATAP